MDLDNNDFLDVYGQIKSSLKLKGFRVYPFQKMPNSYQIPFSLRNIDYVFQVRLKDNKFSVDLSDIIDESILTKVSDALSSNTTQSAINPGKIGAKKRIEATLKSSTTPVSKKDPASDFEKPNNTSSELDNDKKSIDLSNIASIAISGHDNFFGPMVISAVHCNEGNISILNRVLEASNENNIETTVRQISQLCAHSLVIMGNLSYNEFYLKFQNVQLVASWGINRVIKNVYKQTPFPILISNHLGSKRLIQHNLTKDGLNVFYIDKKIPNHAASKAAVLLANHHLSERFEIMKEKYNLTFPLGVGKKVQGTAYKFVEKSGKSNLELVAKLNFPLFEELENKQDVKPKKNV